jgi:hypothetical protein
MAGVLTLTIKGTWGAAHGRDREDDFCDPGDLVRCPFLTVKVNGKLAENTGPWQSPDHQE